VRLAVWLLAVGGCTVAREDFPAAEANALCDLQKRCARGAFHAEWGTMEDCQKGVADDVAADAEAFSWCGYDPAEAARCAARLRHLACGEYAAGNTDEACDLVFDCGFAQ
jgi:hypothetical protein